MSVRRDLSCNTKQHMDELQSSTVTTRVAAVQFKTLHIHFRTLKISEDQKRLNLQTFSGNRDAINKLRNAAYNVVDMIICMEHIVGCINDILSTPELREKMGIKTLKTLNESKKSAEKWKSVRNRLGGHLCIESVENFCVENNYKGVFISDDLETDFCTLNMLAIGSAINIARKTFDIFKRDINIATETQLVVEQLNKDWEIACKYFVPINKFFYDVGKSDKLASIDPDDIKGIVHGD